MDREKVIRALHCNAQDLMIDLPSCDGCDYQIQLINRMGCDFKRLCRDAIALLKEKKHGETFTVIDTKTGKEADEYEIALHEDWAKHLCYCDMDGWAIMYDGTLLLVDECGRFAYADRERFKVVWDE